MSEKGKKPEIIKSAELVMPEDTNNRGTMFGGKVLERMDKLAAITALKHARMQTVTASFDSTDFHAPISKGDLVEMEARVIYTGNSSMVIQVELWSESPFKPNKSLKTRGFMVFVGLDDNGKPQTVPALLVESEREKELWKVGETIKKTLIERRSKTK